MQSDKPDADPKSEGSCEIGVAVDQRLAEIRSLVEADDFAEVERLVGSLPDLVARLPLAARRASLEKIQSFLKDLHAHAESRSDEIRSDLDSLRRGRVATNAYEASTSLFNLKRGM
jgi:prephenate dehydrogenase